MRIRKEKETETPPKPKPPKDLSGFIADVRKARQERSMTLLDEAVERLDQSSGS